MTINLNTVSGNNWLGVEKDTREPMVIAGPCSAESREQVLATAKALAATGKVHVMRAGIWKPRTRPNAFEGVGEVGLEWLKEAGNQTGMLVTTEVAKAQHVEACLKAGIDILWLGARTTVNPFSVQEIADALKGVDIPVMVKNPINPDLQLWIGALERLNRSGINRLAAIHRGFSPFRKNGYRNDPMWEIPIELKRLCPDLDVICDPSHICGSRERIANVSQKALDMDMSGLMIETHLDPDQALSDPQQQLTPDAFSLLIDNLTFRSPTTQNAEFVNRLEMLREMIDEVDEVLLNKLAERMAIVEQIGDYKRENDVTILQIERWEEIMRTRLLDGDNLDLNPEFLKRLLQLIHKESIRKQTDVMNQDVSGVE